MRVISLYQPWAQLIADRRVKLTTKPWPIDCGLVAIHAANRVSADKADDYGYKAEELPQGYILAVVDIKECIALPHPSVRISKFMSKLVDKDGIEHTSMEEGRYAFRFKVVRTFRKPIGPIKAHPKIWELPDEEIWGYTGILRTSVCIASKENLGE